MTINTKLYTDVVDKLNFEPFLDTTHITVGATQESVVTLNGAVKSYAEKRAAENAAKRVRGVKGVANDLQVEVIEPYKRSDTDIATAAIDALKWNVFVPEERIKVVVEI
jgi:osmotically-inducible protein OsmY